MPDTTDTLWMIGRREPAPERTVLRAGEIRVEFDPASGALRCFTVGGREVLRGIYAAVRDRNWGTVEPAIENLKLDIRERSFRIEFQAECRGPGIDFRWTGTIEGTTDGKIAYRFEGRAYSSFRRNRIGFCVLHPLRGVAGAECLLVASDGSRRASRFPELISPHQPFRDLRAIVHEMNGIRTTVTMEGDVFETEDQRNWTDASFKTYGTPLDLPFPVELCEGDEVRQQVTVEVVVEPPRRRAAVPDPRRVELTVQSSPSGAPPALGLGVASDGVPLTDLEISRLREARIAHLRVDLRLFDDRWRDELRRAEREAEKLGASLELAAHLSDQGETEIRRLAAALEESGASVAQVLLGQRGARVTPPNLAALAKKWLGLPVGIGTDAFFAELNRQRPAPEGDFLFFSVNPQVHAFDEDSLMETLEALPDTIRTARDFAGGLPISVSPVTLKPRFNPNATGPEPPPVPGELPPRVDPRQGTLFAAAWTLGAVEALAGAGCRSITWYETAGWRGVMEREAGSPLPDRFHSLPGAVYPVYHVLADLGRFAGGRMVPVSSSDPLRVRGLCLKAGDAIRLLVANLTPRPCEATVTGLPPGPCGIRRLTARAAEAAATKPEEFRGEPGMELKVRPNRTAEFSLEPYEVARIDWGLR